MNLVEELVKQKIADNPFHASGMLNVLECGKLATDEERLERCKLYKAWKQAGENKSAARQNAIDGKPVPELPMEELPRGMYWLTDEDQPTGV